MLNLFDEADISLLYFCEKLFNYDISDTVEDDNKSIPLSSHFDTGVSYFSEEEDSDEDFNGNDMI